jgi:hypothetical protein
MKNLAPLFTIVVIAFIAPVTVSAHCDGIDEPVVRAAQKALESGNANQALIWVKEEHEAEAKAAFQKSVIVRRLNADARELADTYFLETLVRLHRAGEGEPYTGIKPAGRDLGPVIPAVDRALESGSADSLFKLFPSQARAEIEKRFSQVIAKKNFNENEIEAGREFVKQYVSFMHYVEHLHQSAESGGHSHQQSKKPHDH